MLTLIDRGYYVEAGGSELEQLRRYLTVEVKDAYFARKYRPGWDGTVKFMTEHGLFSTGLIRHVVAWLDRQGIRYAYRPMDSALRSVTVSKGILNGITLTKDQLESVMCWFLAGGRGLLWACPGFGKTEAAAACIATLYRNSLLRGKTLMLVNGLDLLAQGRDRLALRLGIKVGSIAGGIWDTDAAVVVGSISQLYTIAKNAKHPMLSQLKQFLGQVEFLIQDECHHGRARSYRKISSLCRVGAHYRLGLSASPFHNYHENDLQRMTAEDVMVMETMGQVVYRTTASDQIEAGRLAAMRVYLVPYDSPDDRSLWQQAYKYHVYRNPALHDQIAQVVKAAADAGEMSLVVAGASRDEYGATITEALKKRGVNVYFLHGKVDKEIRESVRQAANEGKVQAIVATSLHPKELVLIKDSKGVIQLVTIESLYAIKRQFDVWTKLRTGLDGWARVTKVHRHLRKNTVLSVHVRNSGNVYVTENHSLITTTDATVMPKIGEKIAVIKRLPPADNLKASIDVVEGFNKSKYKHRLLIKLVSAPSQAEVRRLKAISKLLKGVQPKEPRTLERWTKYRNNYLLDDKKLSFSIDNFFNDFTYSKSYFRYKHGWPQRSSNLDYLKDLRLNAIICWKESRSKFTLPLTVDVSSQLAQLCGIIAAEGHVRHARGVFIAAILNPPKNRISSPGHKDKRNIRTTILKLLKSVFPGCNPYQCATGIGFPGNLAPEFFLAVMGTGDRSAQKRVPDFLWTSPMPIKKSFLYGYFLGDGHHAINSGTVGWKSVSRHLAVGSYYLLKSIEAEGTKTYVTDESLKYKTRAHTVIAYDSLFYDTHYPKHINQQSSIIKKLTPLPEQPKYVYDLSVNQAERFYAGFGLLCHNTIYDEGVDLPDLRLLIMAGGLSSIKIHQRTGRNLRRKSHGENTAVLVDFVSYGNKHLRKHSRARIKLYGAEPQYDIRLVGGLLAHPYIRGLLPKFTSVAEPPTMEDFKQLAEGD